MIKMADKNDWKKAEMAPSWKPEKAGDEIVGLLIEIQDSVGPNNSKLYTVDNREEEMAVWGSTVLDGRMSRVKIGEEVKIVYKGLGKKKPGQNAPKLFDVFHREVDVTSNDVDF